MSDLTEREPERSEESEESEQAKTKATSERRPRKRDTRPKTKPRARRIRTSASEGRRKPVVIGRRTTKRRRQGLRIVRSVDPRLCVGLPIVGGYVAVGLINAYNGYGLDVFVAFGYVVSGIIGYWYGRNHSK